MTLRLFVGSALAIIFAGAWLVLYWLFWPYQVMANDPSIPVQILNPGKSVRACENVVYQGDTEHLTSGVQVRTSRELVDGVIINYPPFEYVTDGKPFAAKNATLVIPCYTPPGIYHIQFTARFQVNPLRSIVIERRTEEFTVTERTGP